jgi:hypothetical protein
MNYQTFRVFIFQVFFISLSYVASGQGITLKPLGSSGSLLYKSASFLRTEEEIDDTTKIKLPIFEDFTSAFYRGTGSPDSAIWLKNGGTYVNDGFGVKPPSRNVITLDGIAANNLPYNFKDKFALGEADRLTSKRIDLSKATGMDRVVLSFYWQSQGNGSKPDPEDYIALQFRDKSGSWITQWQQKGDPTADNSIFRYVALPVNQPEFFHRDFQFRFQVFCKLSGAYDTWNLDYIFVNSGRRLDEQAILDIATSRIDTYFLKRYRAMPIEQFYANQRNEIVDSVFMITNNLDKTFNIFSYDAILSDLVTKQRLGVMRDSAYIIRANAEQKVAVPTNRVPIPQNRERMILEYKFRLNTGEKDDYVRGANFRNNDTIIGTHVLDNYYAYDDGTAEFAATINQRFGKLAYRFVLQRPAVLTHIDLMFAPIEIDLKGETYNLRVWKRLDFRGRGAKDSVLLVQNTFVNYPDSTNKFQRIELSRRLALSDTFYIGFEQLSDKNISIGFDKNTNSGTEIFSNTTNEWVQNQNVVGSLMMRPVFLNRNAVSINDILWETLSATVYPNPTSGEIVIEGKVSNAKLIDTQGRVLIEKNFAPYEDNKNLDLGNLSNGLYLLYLEHERTRAIKKVILQK